MKYMLVALLFAFATLSFAGTPEEWRSRTIYQLLTDRFARTDGSTTPCADLTNYCGGTFQGIINNLDYIAGMGFDAIWISPIVANMPGNYHGYAAENIYEINSNFGTADDLKNLVSACHAKNIWVMVDVVGNHMGCLTSPGVYSDKVPFNDSSYYHVDVDCGNIDQNNATQLETCWLAQLADLDQDNDYVRSTLLSWVSDIISTYGFDGLRIDTVPYVDPSFWAEYTQASGVYTVGEVFNSNLPYAASFQGPLSGILNYPYFFTLRYVFQQYNSMNNLQNYFNGATTWPDQSLLGNFVDNHDNARFLNYNGDHTAFKSALAFSLCTQGIPIVYYGSEQAFGGGNDPNNREPLWTNMDTTSEIYVFLTQVINIRKQTQFYLYDQIQRYADDSFYAFSRGNYFFAFTNHGYNLGRTITYHPYADGTVLCNLMYSGDCVTVSNGSFQVDLDNGEVKIFAPKQSAEDIAEEKEIAQMIEEEYKSQQTVKAEIEKAEQEIQELLKEQLEIEASGEDEVFKTNALKMLEEAIKQRQAEIATISYQYQGLIALVEDSDVHTDTSSDSTDYESDTSDEELRLQEFLAQEQDIVASGGHYDPSAVEQHIQDLLAQQAQIETSTWTQEAKNEAIAQLSQEIATSQVEIEVRTYQYAGLNPPSESDYVSDEEVNKILEEEKEAEASNGQYDTSAQELRIQQLLAEQLKVETSDLSEKSKNEALGMIGSRIAYLQREIELRTYQYKGLIAPEAEKVEVSAEHSEKEKLFQELLEEQLKIEMSNESEEFKAHAVEMLGDVIQDLIQGFLDEAHV